MKINISPLDELRKEKEILKRECEESETVLAEQWAYLSDNAVSLIFNSVVHGITGKLGFGQRNFRNSSITSGSGGIFQNLLGSVANNKSLIWDLFQPIIWAFIVKKVKNFFKKKK